MRRKLREQLGLVTPTTDHVRARELDAMSRVLDLMPKALDWVHRDLLSRSGKADTGRDAITAEQVLRAMVIKQRFGLSYEELAFRISDSSSVRSFCRIDLSASPPSKSALQRNIKKMKAETWEKINVLLVGFALEHAIESGRKTRTDCTVVETNIHEPSDSSLLWDCVRVLCRLMRQAKETFGIAFRSRRRRAKRRAIGILNAKSAEQRATLYRDLLKVTGETVAQGRRVLAELKDALIADISDALVAQAIEHAIKEVLGHAERVIHQTERRVLRGESVPAADKIVSIFEPHTDIIVKDRRETLYGPPCVREVVASSVRNGTSPFLRDSSNFPLIAGLNRALDTMTPTYTEGFKTRMIERLTGPKAMTATELSREVGVSQPTLSGWLRRAGTISAKVTVAKEMPVAKTDTPEGRLAAVLEASQLSEDKLGAWLRTQGLHGAQIDEWRAAMLAGLEGRGVVARGGGQARRVKELERELRRKDKALAEAAALLILQKKLHRILGDEDASTDDESES